MAETVLTLKQSAAEEREVALQQHQAALAQQAEQHAATLAATAAAAQANATAAAERFEALAAEHRALQTRWAAREPRDEDVALIRQLQGRMAELEELGSSLMPVGGSFPAALLPCCGSCELWLLAGCQSGVVDWMLKRKEGPRKGSANGRTS
ncbi:FAM184 domain-containing protein [Haematococcus lacustris]|uniref:FAM184 domain-containing protein n=1 Tax=Haematococcus lacustris TaxID=44745 RepID=A0A699YZM2_HAELA|nr:FAM184 domain-containing protein [Haematococcus lacustris]